MRPLAGIGAALAAFALATSSQAAAGPSLRLVTAEPLVVSGKGFGPSERVSVTGLTPLGPRAVVVRASHTGTFRASLRLVSQPCGRAFAVRALGTTGRRAVLWLRAAPCVPPPAD